jgi:hypothetical protein
MGSGNHTGVNSLGLRKRVQNFSQKISFLLGSQNMQGKQSGASLPKLTV